MGFFDLNSGEIQDFKVEEIFEEQNYKVLHLSIVTELGETKFRICEDSNEGPLEVIRKELNDALNKVKDNENDHFGIHEIPVRSYIYITFPDGKSKKYTGQRLNCLKKE